MGTNLYTNRKKQQAFWLSLFWSMLVAVIAVKFNSFEFGTNDDRDISNIMANVNGTANTHYIVFINVILTKCFSLLFDWTNNIVNWYTLVSLFASFCALTAISYLLILRTPRLWIGSALSILMLGSLYDHHYVVFQFSQNATLLTTAGCLLLADAVLFGEEESSPVQLVVGILLALFGSMLRFASTYFTLPYLAMFIGYEVVFVKKPLGLRQWGKMRIPQFLALITCLLLIFGARGFHLYTFASDPVLKEFRENNELRGELMDYGFPSYEENAEKMEAMGLNQDDIAYFAGHRYIDRSVYTKEVMEALVEMKPVQGLTYSMENLSVESIKGVYAAIRGDLVTTLLWRVIILCCMLYVLVSNRKRWLVALGSLVVPVVMIWYFVSVQRMPDRVWYSIMAPSVISMLYLFAVDCTGPLFRKQAVGNRCRVLKLSVSIVCTVLLVASVGMVGKFMWQRAKADDNAVISTEYEAIIQYAEAHPETLILVDRPTISPLTYKSTVHVLRVPGRGSHKNLCYQGGWICWTPANLSVLDHFGVTNVYEAMVNGMDVLVIDGRSPEPMLAFLQRHYNENVQVACIEIIHDVIGVYQFYINEATTAE